MKLHLWMAQERDKILRDGSLTQIQAVRRLFGLGYSVDACWAMTSTTSFKETSHAKTARPHAQV